MTNWQELEHKYYMNTTERVPITLVRGQGARVWDEDGREYTKTQRLSEHGFITEVKGGKKPFFWEVDYRDISKDFQPDLS